MEANTMEEHCELPEVPSSIVGYTSQIARYGATALGGYLVGQGWIDGDTAQAMTAIVATAAPILLGLILGRLNRKKLKTAIVIAKNNAAGA